MPRHHLWQAVVSPTAVLGVVLTTGMYLATRPDPTADRAQDEPGILHSRGTGPIYALAYSPDGLSLASGSFHDRVRVWAASTGRPTAEFMDCMYRASALAYSPDSKALAIAGVTPTGNDWSVTIRGVFSSELDTVLRGHTDKVVELAFTPDGKTFASASLDGTVCLWDTSDYHLRMVVRGPGPFHCLAFEAGGRTFLTGGSDGKLRRWDAATGRELTTVLARRAAIHRLAITPDGKTLATWEIGEFPVRLWNAATGASRGTASGHTGFVQALAFARDGEILASAGLDGTVHLWDVATGREKARLRRSDPTAIHSLAFAPDGKVLAVGESGATLTFWDVPRSLAGVATLKPIALNDR